MIWKVITLLTKGFKQKRKFLLKSLIVLLMSFSFVPQFAGIIGVESTEVMAADEEKKQETAQTQTDTAKDWWDNLEIFSNIAYVLLWPLVALAWLLMDNSLIYGSFMNLDVSLWKIWQIVRNFANFTLWFIFLVWILLYNLGWSSWGSFMKKILSVDSPMTLIKKTLVASVLVQMSWFIVMVAVDLSTILTYSIWWLPTTILSQSAKTENNTKMFQTNIVLRMWDEWKQTEKDVNHAVFYYRSTVEDTPQNIAPCKTLSSEGQSFVIWREFSQLSWGKEGNEVIKMVDGYCINLWRLIRFEESELKWNFPQSEYEQKLNKYVEDLINDKWAKIPSAVGASNIIPISAGKYKIETWWEVDGCAEYWYVESNTTNINPNWCWLYTETDLSLKNIIEKWKNMTGPFSALYSSFFNFAKPDSYASIWVWQKFVLVFINSLFGLLLILPLLAFVIVLFARIWILWLVIALSPFIVLAHTFDFMKGMLKWDTIDLDIWSLMKLLLAPVFVSFAVWFSLVFMSVLKNSIGVDANFQINEENKKTFEELTHMKYKDWAVEVLDFIKVKFDEWLLNVSWIITMLFWLWVTRFLLFWAIKATGSVWASIWKTIQKFWEDAFMSAKIIPIWKEWMSLWAISWMPDKIQSEYNKKLQKESDDTLTLMFSDDKAGKARIVDERNARRFFGSWASFGSMYGDNMWVSDLMTKFDNFQGQAVSNEDHARLKSASGEIFGRVQNLDDLSDFVKNENMRKYSWKIQNNKVEWNGKEYDVAQDEKWNIIGIKDEKWNIHGVDPKAWNNENWQEEVESNPVGS